MNRIDPKVFAPFDLGEALLQAAQITNQRWNARLNAMALQKAEQELLRTEELKKYIGSILRANQLPIEAGVTPYSRPTLSLGEQLIGAPLPETPLSPPSGLGALERSLPRKPSLSLGTIPPAETPPEQPGWIFNPEQLKKITAINPEIGTKLIGLYNDYLEQEARRKMWGEKLQSREDIAKMETQSRKAQGGKAGGEEGKKKNLSVAEMNHIDRILVGEFYKASTFAKNVPYGQFMFNLTDPYTGVINTERLFNLLPPDEQGYFRAARSKAYNLVKSGYLIPDAVMEAMREVYAKRGAEADIREEVWRREMGGDERPTTAKQYLEKKRREK